MKIAFLRPNLGGQRSNDAIEPLGFAVLSGLTDRKKHEVVLFDERIEDIPMDLEVDLVVITTFTLTAKRAYAIADNYRKKGVYVVIGGYHASLIPEEVQEYADTVFVGSAEGNWERFLIELENGNPQKVYEEIKLPDISEVVYDRSLFKDKRYSFVVPVQFGRGCMHQCEFCTIGSVHKGDYAHRKVELVIEEIKEIFKTNKRAKVIYFVDDNIFANKKKALHLFNELKKLKIKWACQGSIDIAKDEELVKLMSESGCIEMLLGFENINIMNIKKMNKKSNYDFDYENIIRIFKKYRILVHASYVIGYDYDTKDYFQEILDFSNKHKFFLAGFNPALPIPGTPFYDRLKNEGRLLYDKWWLDDDFRYGKAAYTPHNMTVEEFEAGILRCKVEYNTHKNIWSRLFDGAANFRHALIFLAVNYINRKEIYNKVLNDVKKEYPDYSINIKVDIDI